MIILYLFMMVVFISYVLYVSKDGILPSISASYYEFPDKYRKSFTFFCWGFSFPAVILGIILANSVLLFLGGIGIMFVGAAAASREKLTHEVHNLAAVLGIIFSQLAIMIDFKMWYVSAIVALLSIIVAILKKNSIYWIEIIVFLSIAVTLGYKLFF